MKKILLLIPVFFLVGCFPDRAARDVLATTQPLIIKAQSKYHDSCVADNTQKDCKLINKAVALQDSTIDALNIYCSGAQWEQGGECERKPQFESAVTEAATNLNNIVPDLKGLFK